MRDVPIAAAPVGNPQGQDEVAFTTLWVDVTVATTGTISADNDKIASYVFWTVAQTAKLGAQEYNAAGGARYGVGVESRGKVSPSNFQYPGSDLILERDAEARFYTDRLPNPPSHNKDFNAVIPHGNDTSPKSIQDINPLDSNGYIYDFDAASAQTVPDVQGRIRTARANFKVFTSITVNGTSIRGSGIYSYYVRVNVIQDAPNFGANWIQYVAFPNDNKASGPDVTNLAYDFT